MWYLYMTSYTCTLNFINACENECTFITLDKEGQITTYPIISHHIISQTSIVQYMHKHKFLFNFYGTCICLMITKVTWVMRVRIPMDQYIFLSRFFIFSTTRHACHMIMAV